jgi:DNA-binding NtrC family response regulator
MITPHMYTILVVDDEPDMRTCFDVHFRKNIQHGEFLFLYAHDGAEALHLLQEHPDTAIILTDLNMPTMDGITLLKKLNDTADPPRFTPTAIVISAYTSDYDRYRAAMHQGAFDTLAKPLNWEDLEATLHRALLLQEKLTRKIEALERELIQTRHELCDLKKQVSDVEQQKERLVRRVLELEHTRKNDA